MSHSSDTGLLRGRPCVRYAGPMTVVHAAPIDGVYSSAPPVLTRSMAPALELEKHGHLEILDATEPRKQATALNLPYQGSQGGQTAAAVRS